MLTKVLTHARGSGYQHHATGSWNVEQDHCRLYHSIKETVTQNEDASPTRLKIVRTSQTEEQAGERGTRTSQQEEQAGVRGDKQYQRHLLYELVYAGGKQMFGSTKRGGNARDTQIATTLDASGEDNMDNSPQFMHGHQQDTYDTNLWLAHSSAHSSNDATQGVVTLVKK